MIEFEREADRDDSHSLYFISAARKLLTNVYILLGIEHRIR
jgi:hypothetical protein